MTYKSTTPPLCRYCGGPIAKHTTCLFFGRSKGSVSGHDFVERPASIDEVRKFTNHKVTSVRRSGTAADGSSWVLSANVWDGESYVDEFFCNGVHARAMGVKAAKMGYRMPAYDRAALRQKEETT